MMQYTIEDLSYAILLLINICCYARSMYSAETLILRREDYNILWGAGDVDIGKNGEGE